MSLLISDAALQLSQAKLRPSSAQELAEPRSQCKLRCQGCLQEAESGAPASVAADWQCYQDSIMAQLQTSMPKGDIHTAYKVLQQLCKPSSKPEKKKKKKKKSLRR